jgi:hypothetical protein
MSIEATTNGQVKDKPKIGNWKRPKTGTQFAHIPLAQRATATPLLLHRLKQFDISLPKGRTVYDRIYVYPLEGKDLGDKFEGSMLYKPGQSQNLYGASRGVIVKAGLRALEQMWSHGIELGHIVIVARLSPWERKYEGKGRIHTVMVLRASEIVSSEDLEDDILEECIGFSLKDGRLELEDRPRVDPDENDEGI